MSLLELISKQLQIRDIFPQDVKILCDIVDVLVVFQIKGVGQLLHLEIYS